MAFSDEIRASLVAVCLRSGVVRFEAEAARILATDTLATLAARPAPPVLTNDNAFLFDLASPAPPTSLATDVPGVSVNGPGLAGLLWGARNRSYGGITGVAFKPPVTERVNANGDVVQTAEAVWSSRVSALPSAAAAVIAAATGAFDLAGTRDDILALEAMNPADDPEAWADLYTSLFG